ncbi:MAG: nitrogenase-stabilizing/protective protein NifW [Rubrivivax sp.]
MEDLTRRLQRLSSAEDFMHFFGLPHDPQVLNVHRLHVLKRFHQYLARDEGLAPLGEVELFARYRRLLAQAYADFTVSTAAREKVFKVFQDADGQRVSVDGLRHALAERRSARQPA